MRHPLSACVFGFALALGVTAAGAPTSRVEIGCAALDAEARAELEARANADLATRDPRFEVQFVCGPDFASVVLSLEGGAEPPRRAQFPASDPSDERRLPERFLEALDALADERPAPAPEHAPRPEPARTALPRSLPADIRADEVLEESGDDSADSQHTKALLDLGGGAFALDSTHFVGGPGLGAWLERPQDAVGLFAASRWGGAAGGYALWAVELELRGRVMPISDVPIWLVAGIGASRVALQANDTGEQQHTFIGFLSTGVRFIGSASGAKISLGPELRTNATPVDADRGATSTRVMDRFALGLCLDLIFDPLEIEPFDPAQPELPSAATSRGENRSMNQRTTAGNQRVMP